MPCDLILVRYNKSTCCIERRRFQHNSDINCHWFHWQYQTNRRWNGNSHLGGMYAWVSIIL